MVQSQVSSPLPPEPLNVDGTQAGISLRKHFHSLLVSWPVPGCPDAQGWNCRSLRARIRRVLRTGAGSKPGRKGSLNLSMPIERQDESREREGAQLGAACAGIFPSPSVGAPVPFIAEVTVYVYIRRLFLIFPSNPFLFVFNQAGRTPNLSCFS